MKWGCRPEESETVNKLEPKPHMTDLKFLFFPYLYALLFTSLWFSAEGKEWTCQDLYFEDSFTQFFPSKIYPAAIPHLDKLKLDKTALEKQSIPKDWIVDWGVYPLDGSISCDGKKFRIDSPVGFLRMYGPLQNTLNANYRLEFDISNIPTKKNPAATVKLGIHDYGLIQPGLRVLKEFKVTSPQIQSYAVDLDIMDQYYSFLPMIAVKGSIQIHKLRIYRKKMDGISVVEGEIVERSPLPPPEKSDYPDCRFTVRFKGNSIVAGTSCRRELSLVIDGFKKHRLLNTDKIKPGTKVCCTIIPFEKLPVEKKNTQQSDSLSLFDLDNYYAISVGAINAYKDSSSYSTSGIYFLDGIQTYTSIFERHINPKIPDRLIAIQKKAIADNLEKMNAMLSGFEQKKTELNQQFKKAWEQEKAKDRKGYNRVGRFVWRNMNNSFWTLPENYTLIGKLNYIPQEKLDALKSLQKVLESNGVQLILSPVPGVNEIAARVINPEFRNVPDFQTALFVKQLSEAGIEAIYASDEIIANYSKFPWAFFFLDNYHPSDTCQDVMTSLMAERLERYHLPKTLDAAKFSFVQEPHCYGEDKTYLFPENCDIGPHRAGTSYTNRCVLYDGKKIQSDENSSVLVFGNSYIQTPMNTSFSYPTVLSSKILYGVKSYMIGGTGPMTTIVQNLFIQPEAFLANKKVVILQFGISYFLLPLKWNNLAVMDRCQTLMVGKNQLATFRVPGQMVSYADRNKNVVCIWKELPEKHEFICPPSGMVSITNIQPEQIDPAKKVICVIPAATFPYSSVSLTVNGLEESIPDASAMIRWQNVIFELPAGTKSLQISARGAANVIFAIRNIMIYQ